jgi:hypothetical protein
MLSFSLKFSLNLLGFDITFEFKANKQVNLWLKFVVDNHELCGPSDVGF